MRKRGLRLNKDRDQRANKKSKRNKSWKVRRKEATREANLHQFPVAREVCLKDQWTHGNKDVNILFIKMAKRNRNTNIKNKDNRDRNNKETHQDLTVSRT